jgi:hypothetical protein
MPNINEFIGPKPTKENINNLEKVIGSKPCSKCELDVTEYFWDPIKFIMTWTCDNGHENNVSVNK